MSTIHSKKLRWIPYLSKRAEREEVAIGDAVKMSISGLDDRFGRIGPRQKRKNSRFCVWEGFLDVLYKHTEILNRADDSVDFEVITSN